MNDALINSLNELKIAIEKDPRVLKLNELDAMLNKDEEVMRLAYQKDAAVTEYEDALKHFKEDSIEVRTAQKKLYEAKLKLDLHPLVKQYNEAYKEVRKIYDEINEKIFKKFYNKTSCDK